MPRRVCALVVLAIALVALPTPAEAAGARGLSLGFLDPLFAAGADVRGPWLARAVDSGADVVRVQIGWPVPNTASRPAGFDARNPGDPAYAFAAADAAVTDARARGLRVLLSFTGAPRWAEGRRRQARADPGTWKPDPAAVGDFGAALARRYSGTFPDPARLGRSLPRVDAFQMWNEPNLDAYLTPQWSGGKPFAPRHYRRMLNAFYAGVRSVQLAALVVTAGTAPFGDEQVNGKRIMPVRFVREMLCLRESSGRLRAKTGCSTPTRFDVLAHHPYSTGFPRRRSLNPDDASIPDIGKLTRLLRAAERAGRALPRERHRVWVTEVGYDSSPPDRKGVPSVRHARNLAEAFYLLWKQGVDTITWLRVVDEPPKPSYAATNQSGVYFLDGRAKRSQRAFRFPLVAERAGRRTLRVWGRAPIAGTVQIERRTASGWRVVRTARVGRHATFLVRISARGTTTLRARVGAETSLAWVAR